MATVNAHTLWTLPNDRARRDSHYTEKRGLLACAGADEAPHLAVTRLVLTGPAAISQAEKLRCDLEAALATSPLHSVWRGDEWDGAVLWPLVRGTLTAAVEQLDDLIPATQGRILLD